MLQAFLAAMRYKNIKEPRDTGLFNLPRRRNGALGFLDVKNVTSEALPQQIPRSGSLARKSNEAPSKRLFMINMDITSLRWLSNSNRRLLLALAFALIPLLLISDPVSAQTLPNPISACGQSCIRKSAVIAGCPLPAGANYPDTSCACDESGAFEEALVADCLPTDGCRDGGQISLYQVVGLCLLLLRNV
jgi:hypothetical protein